MKIRKYNRIAWDKKVEDGNRWTIPASPEMIAAARQGQWQIYLTPSKPVPTAWYPGVCGIEILCLAAGGGQQGSILAAAGAYVTVLDNSPRQLAQDRLVAAREGLDIKLVEGDMRNLGMFEDGSFDLIIHPVSNCFVPDILPVWRESYRVLRVGGEMFSGFINPVDYVFDPILAEGGIYQVKYALPYSGLEHMSDKERESLYGKDAPIEFGHTLEDQIGGQLEAGFVITGFYEDIRPNEPIRKYMPSFMATRSRKPDPEQFP